MTACILAAQNGHSDMVTLLVNMARVDVNKPNQVSDDDALHPPERFNPTFTRTPHTYTAHAYTAHT